MTEKRILELFFENYDGNNLNDALTLTLEFSSKEIMKDVFGSFNFLPKIVEDILTAKAHINLFLSIPQGKRFVVSLDWLRHFDHIRKTVKESIIYARDNFELMSGEFKKLFDRESLKVILAEWERISENSSGVPVEGRVFSLSEFKVYGVILDSVLGGIIGMEKFSQYAKEYNNLISVLKRCQAECVRMISSPTRKES